MENVSPLNLAHLLPQPDVRRLFWWKYLNHVDRMLVWAAHIEKIAKELQNSFVFYCDCAQRGYLHVLKWANENIKSHEMECIARIAGKHGHLDILIWVDTKKPLLKYDGTLSRLAAIGGCLHILKWLKLKGVHINHNNVPLTTPAANRGDLPMLKWLRQNDCSWNIYTTIGAVKGGHLEVLEWAIKNGCPYDKNSLFVHSPNQHITNWLLKNL